MEAILEHLIRLLLAVGPWIVFVTTFVETAFFVGLLIPAEATVLLAGALAATGQFSLQSVFAGTFFGALLGDQVGYLLGRHGGNRVVARAGRIAWLWHKYEPVAARLFRRHAVMAVTIARFISFVRTLMPWFAGMSGMKYRQYLLYDFIGVLGWSAASVALGFAAGETWREVAAMIGSATAYLLAALLALLAFVALRKRMRKRGLMRKNGLLRVGLTGNIASGKSTVAEVWRTLGAAIIDADVLARHAVEPGTTGFDRVVRAFGPGVVDNGHIDRAALRAVVFDDEEKRELLESIIHPEVTRMRRAQEAELARAGQRIVVQDIPLLFETGINNEFDIVVLVDAPEAERVARIVRDRGLSEQEAQGMVAAQMPASEKRLPATYVIDNDGTLDELRTRATQVWTEIQEAAR